MAKKKGSAAQRAHRKWFAEMARKGAFRKGKKGKKRKNPSQKWKREKPLPRETVTVRWPAKSKMTKLEKDVADLKAALSGAESEYNTQYKSPFARKFLLGKMDSSSMKMINKLAKMAGDLSKTKAQRDAAKAKILELKKLAEQGKAELLNTDKESKNPMKKRKKRRARRNPKAPDYGMITVPNPKKRKRKAKKRKAKKRKAKRTAKRRSSKRRSKARRRSSAIQLVKPVAQSRRRKWAKKKKGKLRARIVLGNPVDFQSAKPYLYAGLGYIAMIGLYKVADHYSGGKISAQVNQLVPPAAQAFVLPAIGIAIGYAAHRYASDIPVGSKGQEQIAELGKGAMLAGGVLAGLAAINAAVGLAKQQFPQMATMPVIGPMFAGVEYFPGMHGPDFGALGDGYRQSGADFGNVKFFPAGMQGVEYFPEGSRGDQMYVPTEAQQLREAQGLGVIPEGMGEIPEGLGQDEGQMG